MPFAAPVPTLNPTPHSLRSLPLHASTPVPDQPDTLPLPPTPHPPPQPLNDPPPLPISDPPLPGRAQPIGDPAPT